MQTKVMKISESKAAELIQKALSLHRAGDLQGASQIYEMVTKARPSHADAWGLLGLVVQSRGKADLAVNLQSRAIALFPHANYFANRASAYLDLKKYTEAASDARKAVKLDPLHESGYINLLNALQQLGKLSEAIAQGQAACARLPLSADLLNNLGSCYVSQGALEDALQCFAKAVGLDPNHPYATASLAKLAWSRNDMDTACELSRTAYAMGCADAKVLYPWLKQLATGNDHAKMGEVALRMLTQPRATEILAPELDDLDFINLIFTVANRKQAEREFDHSHRLLGLIHAMRPGNADILNNLAVSHFAAESYDKAADYFEQALAIKSDRAISWLNLGTSQLARTKPEEALVAFAKAYELEPTDAGGLLYYLGTKLQVCDWTDLDELKTKLVQLTKNTQHTDFSGSIAYLSTVESAQDMREIAFKVGAVLFANSPTLASAAPVAKQHSRIRIGYYSYDFRAHPVSYLTEELYRLHDRSRFEIYALSYGPDDGSIFRKTVQADVDHFIELAHLPHAQSAQLIRNLELDIVVDLSGNTQGTRSAVLGCRVAPVQCHWLGYVWSMGHRAYDYIIADDFSIPPALEFAYVEKPVRLPYTLQIQSRRIKASETALTRAQMRLPEEAFVFANFTAFNKYQPEIFNAWLDILNSVPKSVLWLARNVRTPPEAFDRLRAFVEARDIDPERIVFSDPLPRDQYLRMYDLVDLLLDTYPQGSGTTAIEALWMGCPLLSMAAKSETLSGRMAGGILLGVGLDSMITDSTDAYKRRAVELANSPEKLHEIRAHLRDGKERHPLFDTPQKVKYLEQAFERMHERALAGLAPTAINITAA
jgi:protein O-GlcNAc transferase